MSEKTLAQLSRKEEEIPCMLLPMGGYTLLVPTVSVAEMAPVKPLEVVADSPDWLLGMYDWRNTRVPVVSIDVLNGDAGVPVSSKGRIAVLNNTGVSDELPFIAIHTQGIPRMTRVGEKDIVENPETQKKAFHLMAVKIGLEEFLIPDIAALENAYCGLRR